MKGINRKGILLAIFAIFQSIRPITNETTKEVTSQENSEEYNDFDEETIDQIKDALAVHFSKNPEQSKQFCENYVGTNAQKDEYRNLDLTMTSSVENDIPMMFGRGGKKFLNLYFENKSNMHPCLQFCVVLSNYSFYFYIS